MGCVTRFERHKILNGQTIQELSSRLGPCGQCQQLGSVQAKVPCHTWGDVVLFLLRTLAVLQCAAAIQICKGGCDCWQLNMQVEYWRKQLEGIPSLLEMPTSKRRPAEPSGQAFNVPFIMTGQLFSSIKRVATSLRASPLMIVIAAFQACCPSPYGIGSISNDSINRVSEFLTQ